MTQVGQAEPVHYHDCPALGPHTKTIHAFMVSEGNEFLLGRQLKCPFCSTVGGPFIPAPGVTQTPDGRFMVDPSKATRIGEA